MWVLVGDASRARILRPRKRGEKWEVLETHDHPLGRARTSEMVSDQRGRQQQSGAEAMRPGMEPRTDPTDVEAENFARELAQRLQKGFDTHEYQGLILVAAPRFLGQLRGTLHGSASSAVLASVDKDYTHADEEELEKRLRKTLDEAYLKR